VIVASVPNMHVRRVFFLEIAVLVGFSLQHGGAAARVSRRHTPPMSTSGCLVAVAATSITTASSACATLDSAFQRSRF